MHIKYLQIFFITNVIDRDVFKQKAHEHLNQERLSLNSDSATYEACHPEYVNISESEIS